MCSKCSKYLENDVNDRYKQKLPKARSDWLPNLRISLVIHLSRNLREICVRTNYNRCRNKWVKPYFCVYYLIVLVHTIYLSVGDWRWVFTAPRWWKVLTDIARWHEFRENHSQMICMVSDIFNSACEWKELLKIWEYIENSNQVQNDGCLTPVLEHQLRLFMCTYRLLCCEI